VVLRETCSPTFSTLKQTTAVSARDRHEHDDEHALLHANLRANCEYPESLFGF
jgi:hypothetical protein